jgi:cardiolipin synthase
MLPSLPVPYIFAHLLSIAETLFIVYLLSNILQERRAPASSLAWILIIIALPYVGIPFYLIIGNRKLKKIQKYSTFPLNGIQKRYCRSIPVLYEGEQAMIAVEELISNANYSVAISTFVLGDDATGRRILQLLIKKAREGVKVFLLIDGVGSFWAPGTLIEELKISGGKVEKFLPLMRLPFKGRANLRNHRKIIITDGQKAIVGGMNLAERYLGYGLRPWRDLSFIIEGGAGQDLRSIFESDWVFANGGSLSLASDSAVQELPNTETDNVTIPSLEVIPSGPDIPEDLLYERIIDSIFHAKRTITIVTPYFIPDETLLKALCMAARKELEVHLYIPKNSNHPLADFVRVSYLNELHRIGAHIHLFTETMLHAKLILIDGNKVIFGSANMDIRSMLLNYEIGLISDDINFALALSKWCMELDSNSIDYSPATGTIRDTIQGMARVLAPLL